MFASLSHNSPASKTMVQWVIGTKNTPPLEKRKGLRNNTVRAQTLRSLYRLKNIHLGAPKQIDLSQ